MTRLQTILMIYESIDILKCTISSLWGYESELPRVCANEINVLVQSSIVQSSLFHFLDHITILGSIVQYNASRIRALQKRDRKYSQPSAILKRTIGIDQQKLSSVTAALLEKTVLSSFVVSSSNSFGPVGV
jgi:hypothetical protein